MREEGVSIEDIKTCFLGKVSQAKGPGGAQAQLKEAWMFRKSKRPCGWSRGTGEWEERSELKNALGIRLSFWVFTLRQRPLEGGEKSSDMTEFFMRTIPAAISRAVGGEAGCREPRLGGKCSVSVRVRFRGSVPQLDLAGLQFNSLRKLLSSHL